MENESKQKNDAQLSIIGETIDFTYLFCPFCLSYPAYSIDVKNDGEILLKHLCKNSEIKDINLNEIKSYKRFISLIKCKYCEKYCQNICLKCGEYICNKCSKEHANYSSEYSINMNICSILDKQYLCKEHFMRVTNYCNICKIHLCNNECLREHCHINCYPLYEKINDQKFEKNYEGKNNTLLKLALISKLFDDCYSNCLRNSNMTINIILNHSLVKKIKDFIEKNKDKYNIKNKTNIITKTESILKDPRLFKVYGGEEFQDQFFNLIFFVETGNIRAFHKLEQIKKIYQKNKRPILSMNPTKRAYLISLNNLINEKKNELLLLSNVLLNENAQYCLLETIEKVRELQTLVIKLNLDLELLIKYTISLNYRVDYEQRRKIGNLIADKMLTLFPENIETIKINEYLLGLAIESIETKINKLNNLKENGEKEKLEELKNKYNKGLKLLNNLTSTKLEKINKTDYDITKFIFDKTSIQFINKKNDPNNKKAIILNLYFIIRKLINESMNKSIHNETVKINYIIKEEISEFEKKEKNVNPNQEILKKEERKDNNVRNTNFKKLNKTCPKNEIVNIMNKIEFKPIALEKDENLLEEIELRQKEKVLDSNLLEIYQHLKKIKNKIYNIRSEINFSKAIELFMEGEKNGLLEEKEINEDNKILSSESYEDKIKIEKLLDESSKTISIKLINSYFNNTITNINEALLHLNSIHFKTIEYIIDYAEFLI